VLPNYDKARKRLEWLYRSHRRLSRAGRRLAPASRGMAL